MPESKSGAKESEISRDRLAELLNDSRRESRVGMDI